MDVRFTEDNRGNRLLVIDGARIMFRNFRGEGSKYNREGDRNFALVIPNQELADKLINDTNEDGAGWNVKIKAPRDGYDDPLMYLPVKIKFTGYGPNVYLITNGRQHKLEEEDVARLDRIEIASVDLDIRAYDNITQGRSYRTAYLQSIRVHQGSSDRFADSYDREDDTPFYN